MVVLSYGSWQQLFRQHLALVSIHSLVCEYLLICIYSEGWWCAFGMPSTLDHCGFSGRNQLYGGVSLCTQKPSREKWLIYGDHSYELELNLGI
jgi:hypothetical protein